MSSANTSLGFGHATCVDMRTCMYETRKQEKMNVSESRKIHIIALPHGTGKACLSPAKSVTTLRRPSAACACWIDSVITSTAIGASGKSSRGEQQPEQHEPHGEQEMPVDAAELHRDPRAADRRAAVAQPRRRTTPDDEPADHVQRVHGGEQVEE